MVKQLVLGLATALALSAGHAQIRIGQTAAFTGGPASTVKEVTLGAKLIIEAANEKGGIHGQRIELVQMDDGFEPARAAKNAEVLIRDKKVSALFLSRGTPTAEAMLPILEKYGIPLIAPSTGAMSLRNPVHPWVFNVRSSYQKEAEKAIQVLDTMTVQRIGVVQINDSFGKDAMEGADRAFKRYGRTPLFVEKFDRKAPNFASILEKIKATRPDAVLVFASTEPTVELIRQARNNDSTALFVTLSTSASSAFIRNLGPYADNTVVTQVFPNNQVAHQVVRDLRARLEVAMPGAPITPAMIEGAVSARVLIAGLQRAGRNPSGRDIKDALENAGVIDIGLSNLSVRYSPTDHTGMDYADLSIIARNKFQR